MSAYQELVDARAGSPSLRAAIHEVFIEAGEPALPFGDPDREMDARNDPDAGEDEECPDCEWPLELCDCELVADSYRDSERGHDVA